MSFKCLCRFYNSLQLLMCDCEDLVPAQELKGTSLPSPVVDSWDWEDEKRKMLNLFWKCKVCTLEDCASQTVKRPILCFSHKMFQNCSCQRKVKQTCSVNGSLTFVLVYFFTWKISTSECNSSVKDIRLHIDCDHVLRQTPVNFFWFTVMAIVVENVWLCKLMSVIIVTLFDYVPINNKH